MFWFGKKKEKAEEIVPTNTSIEEEMGLKEYVSFDSVKAHLVDILEENRRLKQEEKRQVCRRLSIWPGRWKCQLTLFCTEIWGKMPWSIREMFLSCLRTVRILSGGYYLR